MLEFIRGPLIWISFLIFVLGLLYQAFRFFTLTQKKEWVFIEIPFNPDKPPSKRWTQRLGEGLIYLKKKTIWGHHPLMAGITSVFHISLFIVPLFLLGHNILLEEAWGISLWSFGESFSDKLTCIPLGCGGFFLFRRLFIRKVRVITTTYDYVALGITLAPFVTGYLTYHQYFNYQTMIHLHILAGEVMFITIPFTKLGHMLFFFLYRFFIGSEYSFARGTRTW